MWRDLRLSPRRFLQEMPTHSCPSETERSLFGIEYEGSWRLPRFQFERRLVIPGLAQVLKSLPPDLFPIEVRRRVLR
jgi:hypothetical protein